MPPNIALLWSGIAAIRTNDNIFAIVISIIMMMPVMVWMNKAILAIDVDFYFIASYEIASINSSYYDL